MDATWNKSIRNVPRTLKYSLIYPKNFICIYVNITNEFSCTLPALEGYYDFRQIKYLCGSK